MKNNNTNQEIFEDDTFTLYDIVVEVTRCQKGKLMVCNHTVGDRFFVRGENISFPDGQTFPLYPLAALLPLIPAKQRMTHPNDWMSTDQEVACPDPHCGAIFEIRRSSTTTFRHSEVTVTQLKKGDQNVA